MRNRVLAACALALLAAGCAPLPAAQQDVPLDVAHAPSTQKTARAVHHWDVLAADVAAHVAVRLREWPEGQHPIHVAVAPHESGFNRGFRELLVTRLVELGIAVSTEPTAVNLQVKTQLVQHHAGAAPTGGGLRLAEGVQVRRDAAGVEPAATWEQVHPMRTEVLVVTSLEHEGRALVRTSDMYSIAQADAPLYLPRPPAPVTVRTWQVVP